MRRWRDEMTLLAVLAVWIAGHRLMAASLAAPADADPLDRPCPVEWRAVPLQDAVRDLAERLNVAYVVDSSVTDDMLKRPVRLVATHLSGRQAFRWTVRVAGLEAVLVDDAMLIAPPDRLPLVWRTLGGNGAISKKAPRSNAKPSRDPSAEWIRVAEAQRGDLAWTDAPLSRVARDISAKFGLDVVFHRAILAEEPLVRLEGSGLALGAVRKTFSEQLKAASRYEDGVIWVEPADPTATGPAVDVPGTAPATPIAPPPRVSLLSRPVSIELGGAGWGALEQTLARAAGVTCRIETAEGTEPPALTARGSLAEVLEAMRLLAGWRWRIERSQPDDGPVLVVLVPAGTRSPK